MNIIIKKNACFVLCIFLIVFLVVVFLKKRMSSIPDTVELNQMNSRPTLLPTDLQHNPLVDDDIVRCPADVRRCSDGTYVSRVAPNCSFAPCAK